MSEFFITRNKFALYLIFLANSVFTLKVYQSTSDTIGTIHKLRRQASEGGGSQMPMLLHKLM